VEVVGQVGDMIRVRTLPPELTPQCMRPLGFESEIQLQFWSGTTSLSRVLSEPAERRFEDGTSIELVAGTPYDEMEMLRNAYVGDHNISVRGWELSVNVVYRPPPARTLPPAPIALPSGTQLGHEGSFDVEVRDGMFSHAVSERHDRQGRLLTFENPCGRFVLRELPRKRSARHEPPAREPTPHAPRSGWTIGADVELTWPDGEAAGRTLAAFELNTPPSFDDARGCFDLDLGFRVCAPRDALREAPEDVTPQ
jgi:hypothetical protein